MRISRSCASAGRRVLTTSYDGVEGTGIHMMLSRFKTGGSDFSVLSVVSFSKLGLSRDLVAGLIKGEEDEIMTGTMVSVYRRLKYSILTRDIRARSRLGILRRLKYSCTRKALFGGPVGIRAFRIQCLGR